MDSRSVFAADINGDEKIDVVVGGGEIKWFLNNINSMATNSWTSVEVSYTSSGAQRTARRTLAQ